MKLPDIASSWLLSFPNALPTNPYSFSFQANTGVGNFTLTFIWATPTTALTDEPLSRWLLFVTLPSGEVRQAGVFPNDVSWTGFTDYGFYVQTTLLEIGQNDLSSCAFYILKWQS